MCGSSVCAHAANQRTAVTVPFGISLATNCACTHVLPADDGKIQLHSFRMFIVHELLRV